MITALEASDITAKTEPERLKAKEAFRKAIYENYFKEIEKSVKAAAEKGDRSTYIADVEGNVGEDFYEELEALGYRFGKATITRGGIKTEYNRGNLYW